LVSEAALCSRGQTGQSPSTPRLPKLHGFSSAWRWNSDSAPTSALSLLRTLFEITARTLLTTFMEEQRTPGGPSHWVDLKPRSILKTDATVAAKKDAVNRKVLDRQRNEIALKFLVLGAPRTVCNGFTALAFSLTRLAVSRRCVGVCRASLHLSAPCAALPLNPSP
jgi:hypothetical protein